MARHKNQTMNFGRPLKRIQVDATKPAGPTPPPTPEQVAQADRFEDMMKRGVLRTAPGTLVLRTGPATVQLVSGGGKR